MESTPLSKKVSRLYLLLVPILVVVFGFGLGRISYTYYLPIWLVNVCLMVLASWVVGLHVIKTKQNHFAVGSFFLIVPIILISWFFDLAHHPIQPKNGWQQLLSNKCATLR